MSLAVIMLAAASAVSLDGAWEMAYSSCDRDAREYPSFQGVEIANAVPGYWEDMTKAFRAAGMRDEFRLNPRHSKQTFPIRGQASDTTLPDIRGTFFYRRHVTLDRTADAALSFEGVRNGVHVWINGAFVASHCGYSVPFELPVPASVLKRGTNEIVLAVCNGPVRGYCDYVSGLTSRGLFASTGGVNGHLELIFREALPPKVHVTTAADLKTFTVHVAGPAKVRYAICDGGRVCAEGEVKGEVTLKTDGYEFWSPERPKRYELKLTTPGGTVTQKFGIRRLAARGEKLFLNGQPVYLRGVTEHCYFAQTVHVPRDLDYYRKVTAKRKELGFNFVRFHTFVPPVEYLEATDELGMLVHIESPNFVTEQEYSEIIAFARRHPSVVIYCTGNETRIDRIAESYLESVSGLVHTMTDALFSPMSAMRGVEYALVPGKDPTVASPFRHNAERMSRLCGYCDLFTSYQLGLTSYDSLNGGPPKALDDWGNAYGGKPRTSHEICIDGSYADLSLEKLYPPDSPILKAGIFSGIRAQLEAKGLLDRADAYFRNSCAWMRRIRKFTFEKLRAADRVAGYDFLGDINTHWHTFGYSVGLMDEFYRLKPGETVENVLRYNSAAVLLCDLGSDFNMTAGTTRRISFSVSNYAKDMADARLSVSLVDDDGRVVWQEEKGVGKLANGRLAALSALDVRLPESGEAKKYALRARVDGLAANEWEIYAFPRAGVSAPPENLRVVSDISGPDLQTALAKGERVLLLGTGPFKSLPSTYRIGMAGRCSGNYATTIRKGHPALEGLPHEGFCGWQFRRLMEGGRAVQLEAGVPFDPIIDVASSVKCVIRQAFLFEYRVGAGRLLVCSFKFSDGDPAAVWLRERLKAYAASGKFEPESVLSSEQLQAVIAAPLVTGEANSNVARNPNDPASVVRAGKFAQP